MRSIELGGGGLLPKPFDPVPPRARIGACLEKKRLRDREAKHLRELAEWNQKLEQRVDNRLRWSSGSAVEALLLASPRRTDCRGRRLTIR